MNRFLDWAARDVRFDEVSEGSMEWLLDDVARLLRHRSFPFSPAVLDELDLLLDIAAEPDDEDEDVEPDDELLVELEQGASSFDDADWRARATVSAVDPPTDRFLDVGE